MSRRAYRPERVIVAKFGVHAGESVESIVARKTKECSNAPFMLWGYGGSLLDPLRQAQPFCRDANAIHLAMMPTPSGMYAKATAATAYSADRRAWRPLPKGVGVTGSTKAFVCRSLEVVDLELDAREYEVATGGSAGTPLADYLRFHIDKACAIRRGEPVSAAPSQVLEIVLLATLMPPFAVYLDTESVARGAPPNQSLQPTSPRDAR